MALVSQYGLNEGSGTTSQDSSGNNRHITTSPTAWKVGRAGWAYGLGGGGAVGQALGPASMPSRTIMAWVRLDGTGSHNILESGTSGAGLNTLYVYGDVGTWKVGYWDEDSDVTIEVNASWWLIGEWYHVAVSTGPDGAKLITDGLIREGGTNPSTVSRGMSNASIGGTPGYEINGCVDEVRVFDTQLVETEVQDLMYTPVRSFPQPVGEYGFFEGSGTTAADTSGGGHNITVSGTAWKPGKTDFGLGGAAASGQVLGPTGPMPERTVGCWFKIDGPNPNGGKHRLVSFGSGGTLNYLYVTDPTVGGGQWRVGFTDEGAPLTTEGVVTIDYGQWHYLTAGTGTGGTALHLDGNFVEYGDTRSSQPVTNAAIGGSGNDTLNGVVDDLRTWNTILGTAENTVAMNLPVVVPGADLPMYVGTTAVSGIQVGTATAEALYFGSTKLWP